MITGALKSNIDKLWEEFWTGGITNPLTVIEQITFLMYARLLDMNETTDEKRSRRTGKTFKRRFNRKQQHLRWHKLMHIESADKLLETVRDELFPYFKESSAVSNEGTLFAEFMKDAQLMIQKPSLLVRARDMVNDLPLEKGDTKGDLYEYLLSKLTTAGINGQFRTPRHIIRAIIELMDPDATDRICDPACGTAGFLSTTYEFILQKYSSPEGTITERVTNEKGEQEEQTLYTGDLLSKHRRHVDRDMFHGFDFDATMLRIAAMNLVMHGVAQPDIHYQDTLSQGFIDSFPKEAKEGFDLVLANPPFKGSLDEEDVDPEILRTVKTKKTELLFVALILRMLKVGGRAAVIVPIGVVEGETRAHTKLRKVLLSNQVEAVIGLPHWIFKPYASVATAVLIFSKGGNTDKVWFYGLQNDGYSDGAKKEKIPGSELSNLVSLYKNRFSSKYKEVRSKHRFVSIDEIKDNNFDLCPKIYLRDYEHPKNVPTKRLGELFDISRGTIGAAEAMSSAEKFDFITTSADFKKYNSYSFDSEAVCIPLVSSTGHGHASINNIHYIDGKFEAATIMAVLTPKESYKNTSLTKYVYSYLLSHKDDVLVPYMKGAANVSLTVDRIARIKISFPNKRSRDGISKMIFETKESISLLRESLREEEEKYRALVKSVKNSL
ncbi:N-6 DNA methylase [Microbulbifer variabilis]|uniref:N-6 DNA methylase n=1 Tax=Microbulbifer variabilis TaxID=266805 RepID=UPI001CFC75CE|nr:N-6 DNA methylase [Microbulbifer variabilis]